MPLACGNTVLTGANGSIAFVPAGTTVCLRDFSDFPSGTDVTLPDDHGFETGDIIEFEEMDGGHLDAGITTAIAAVSGVSGPFVITAIDNTVGAKDFKFATKADPDTGITLSGDGGTSTADNPLPAHIQVRAAEFEHVCNVRSFSISLDRESIDTTSLMCACTSGTTANLAEFRTAQAGYASGEGTMEVMFTESQTNLANRLLKDSLKKNQDGAAVRLYINTVCSGTSVDDSSSLYIEAPISIMGFSINVTPEDVITATVNFSFSGQPTEVL